MKLIDNMRVSAKIALCAGTVLVLLLVVGAIAVLGLGATQANFGTYRSITERTTAASQLQSAMLSASIAIKNFMLSSSTEAEGEAKRNIQTALSIVEVRDDDTVDPQLAERLAAIQGQLDAYSGALGEVVPLQARRDSLVAELGTVGDEADATATALLKRQRQLTNATATYNASMVMRNLLLAGLNMREFLSRGSQEAAERTKGDFAALAKALKTLDRTVSDTEGQALVDAMNGLVIRYEGLFDEVAATVAARNALIAERIDTIGPALASQMEQARQANSLRLEELGTATLQDAERMLWLVVGVVVVALLVGIVVATVVGRGIARPVQAMTAAMQRLAHGEKDAEVPARDRKDEVGEMAEAVQVFKDNMIRNDEMAAEQAEAQAAREDRAKRIEALTQDFDRAVAAVLAEVGTAAQQMQGTAASMSATADETNRQASAVASASEEASTNVQTVASAAEELSSSIEEIGRQVAQSATIAAKASTDAERTNIQVDGLAQAAQRIGEVVSLIQDIAEQTNLLALNATIEAARAGEAGKGFAVVASEVKNLANQTAKATEQIGQQIGGIQSETNEAVTAIQGIGRTITQINEIATAIASAVEEQGAATQEISRNVQEAARGTQEVSGNIAGVTRAAADTGDAADQVNQSAANLAGQADRLRSAVEDFLGGVRAA